MANSITLFKQYINLLDEVYKVASKTSVLDIDGALVQAGANANEIVIKSPGFPHQIKLQKLINIA